MIDLKTLSGAELKATYNQLELNYMATNDFDELDDITDMKREILNELNRRIEKGFRPSLEQKKIPTNA